MPTWLPLFSLSLLPLELLLLQLLLAGADPGAFPMLEVLLLWALGVLMPQLWGAIRLPLGLIRPLLALLQLPLLIWLNSRAGAYMGASPLTGSSRIGCLLWSLLLLLGLQWQLRSVLAAVAIQPQQAAANEQSAELNGEISAANEFATGEAQGHGGGTEASGGEQGEPEGAA